MTGRDEDGEQRGTTLHREIRRARRNFRIAAFNCGVTYYTSRVTLILASAVVAAGETLHGRMGWLIKWAPGLSLLVAVLTALDAWLKPQLKWQGLMESRDDLTDLLIRVEGGLTPEDARTRFVEIRAKHRDSNIF
ncbi:hypothetical protein [Streptomyces chartreusis]|uniref:hypothetical protein n=1 Tax=Streptomyces chartreusis TaxID=1969 RepID=UPI0036C438F1